jgi:SagB-type dehydrogenase family enzyme
MCFRHVSVLLLGIVAMAACGVPDDPSVRVAEDAPGTLRPLPSLVEPLPGSLEEVIAERRSVREYADRQLEDADVGRLLWAAQGITDAGGKRAAPSAGATYPLEVYITTAEGIARYRPEHHALEIHLNGDRRRPLATAAHGQSWLAKAPLMVVVVGVVERTASRYGDRASRYMYLEAGHAVQNVLLQAVALGLAAAPVGAFDDQAVADLLELPVGQAPLYLIPVGYPTV